MSPNARGRLVVVDPSPFNWLWITWNTMEELVGVNVEGHGVPSLASEWHWLDERTLEFELRQGVVYHNGERFDAQQVKRSFDEVQRWEVPHPPGAWLNFPKESTCTILDDYHVRFNFPRPDSIALVKFRGVHVPNQQFWKELGFGYKTSGSGEGHW